MEEQRARQERRREAPLEQVMPGFTRCSSCGEDARTEDLYASAEGSICPHCVVEMEMEDAVTRDLREQAKSVFLAPGLIGLALMLFMPLTRIYPAGMWMLAVVPLVGVGVGGAGVLAAVRSRGDTVGRVFLTLAGLSTTVISLLGVYAFLM